MPENAEIWILEDDADYAATMSEFLGMAGHIVYDVLNNLVMFEATVNSGKMFSDPKKGILIADGNLQPGDTSGRDGARAVAVFRKQYPDRPPLIIGRSSGFVSGADYQMKAGDVSNSQLAEEITKL